MKNKRKLHMIIGLTVIFCGALLIFTNSIYAEKWTIKIGHSNPKDSRHDLAAKKFGEMVLIF